MTDQHHREEDERRQMRPESDLPELYPAGRADAAGQVTRVIRGERMACYELMNAFLPGKRLYMGWPEPYQFVEVPESGGLGLQLASCPCPLHRGGPATHILNMSEVSLVLECGPDRVWVFITIPARHRAKYIWLPALEFGLPVDEELSGYLVAVPDAA